MKRFFMVLTALLFVSPLVFAIGAKTFTWTPPTERDDDTPLPNSEIAEYRIYCDNSDAPIHVQLNEPLNTDMWAAPDGTFASGDHTCTATAVDTEGRVSVRSNIVNFTVDKAAPKAPVFALQ